jgi:serine/threonine protein kinase
MHPSAGKDCLERFQTEIKICAKLNHPNIVEIHSVGEWHGLPFIEMERLEGHTLENLLKERGPLPPTIIVAAGILACRGLSFAHNHEYQLYGKNYHGVIHRDLKPSNLMFCQDGQIKIMDFGIARPLDASLHTVDGSVVGTLQYLSPEQLNGGSLDVRSDIYALGELLYEALCGSQAFPEKSVTALLNDKTKNRFKPLTDFQIHAPRELLRLIHKSMARDRESRISSALAFERGLKAVGDKLGISDPQETVQRYMNTPHSKRKLPLEHKPSRFISVVTVSLFFVAVFAAIAIFLLINTRDKVDETEIDNEVIEQNVFTETPIENSSIFKDSVNKTTDSVPVAKVVDEIIIKNTTGKNNLQQNTTPQKSPVPVVSIVKKKVVSNRPVTPPPSIRQLSQSELLKEEFGIPELPSLLTALYTRGRYSDVLTVYDELSSEVSIVPKNAVMALRSHIAAGNQLAIDNFLSTRSINDAEFFLAKANQELLHGKIEMVMQLLSKAENAPRVLLTYDDLKREVSYLQALYATSIFKKAPDEATYKEALDKWRNLRASLSSNPTHKYLQIEKEERKQMGHIYASLRKTQ